MTSLLERPDPVDLLSPERRRAVLAVAVVAGAALGVVDLLMQLALPYPWANLANSSAVWALAAFGYGVWLRTPGVRAAVGGAVLLVTAVVAYYLAAVPLHGDAVSNVWAPTSLVWVAFGVVAGVVFATFGAWRWGTGWRPVTAAAAAGAVCFAEFALVLGKADEAAAPARADLVETAVITAVLGLVVLVVSARRVPTIGRALLASVPLAALGYAGFAAAGFSGALG